MNFKNKFYFTLINLILFTTVSIIISNNLTFHGDEIGTLEIEKIHKPVPYHHLISGFIKYAGELNPTKIFLYRSTSLVFTLIAIAIWSLFFLKEKKKIVVFSFIILTNSLIIRESIFFRYYSYYFLSSTIVGLFLIRLNEKTDPNIKLILSLLGALLSPYLFYVLNTLQFAFYFLYIFIFEKIQNIMVRYLSVLFICFISISILLKPLIIWNLFSWLKITDQANFSMKSEIIHGLTLSVIIKPLYAIFQMIFGYHIAPTESFIIAGFFIFLFITFFIILFKIFLQNKKTVFLFISIFIIPFLTIYLVFQSISIPGFTQLESKHGMMIMPLIIILAINSIKYLSQRYSKIFLTILIISQLTGAYNLFKYEDANFNLIIKKINNSLVSTEKKLILMDGRSKAAFNLYNQNMISDTLVSYTYQSSETLKRKIKNQDKIYLILNDYKSYHQLSLRQNWNAGNSSLNRFYGLSALVNNLNVNYFVTDSYVNYPLFFYMLEKKIDMASDTKSFSIWEHNLKDLSFPIKRDPIIYSSVLISPLDSLKIRANDKLIINLEGNTQHLTIGESVGLYNVDKKNFEIIYGENIWDIFAEYNNVFYRKENVFHSWIHRPLVSGSIKYPGSYFRHKASIYSIDIQKKKSNYILIKNISKNIYMRVWI